MTRPPAFSEPPSTSIARDRARGVIARLVCAFATGDVGSNFSVASASTRSRPSAACW